MFTRSPIQQRKIPTPQQQEVATPTAATTKRSADDLIDLQLSSPTSSASKRLKRFAYGDNSSEENLSDDAMDKILAAIAENNRTIKTSSDAQMAKFEELSVTVSTQLTQMRSDVAKVVDRVDQHENDIESLKRRLNDIEQEKLASHIEIAGVAKTEIEKNSKNITAFARNIIASFVIQFNQAVVEHAFVRTIPKSDIPIIVVRLSSIEAKLHIMKMKRESDDQRKIFFDHRLTPLNRALFSAARKATKEEGWKTFISSGRIFIARDNEKHRIISFADIDKFKTHSTDPAMVTNDVA